MSVMNLGLEALGIQSEKQVLSYEYLDAVIEYSDACDEMNIVFDQFDTVLRAAQNLEAVRDVIASQGITPALEALVGGNFKDGFSAEAVEASLEAAGEALKNFFVKIWQAIKTFFTKLFVSAKGMVERLDAWLEKAKTAKAEDFDGREFKGYSKSMLLQGGFKNYVAKLGANFKEGDLPKSNSSFDLGAVTLDFESAKTYAKALSEGMKAVIAKRDEILKTVNEKINAAQAAEKEEDKAAQTEEAKSAKTVVKKVYGTMQTVAAGFLSHNIIGGGKSKKAAPAEGEQKPEDAQEETPAEGEEQK